MERTVKVALSDGKSYEGEVGSRLIDIIKTGKEAGDPVIAKQGNEIIELSKQIHYNVSLELLNTKNPIGHRTYLRSLTFLLIKAVDEIYPDARVVIEHSLSKSIYGEIHFSRELNEQDIAAIKEKMIEIVQRDMEIEKIKISKEEAFKIFESYEMSDKLRLLKYINIPYINLYRCGDLYDYFYGPMVPSTGYLKLFDLKYYKPGFILMYPHEDDIYNIEPFKDLPKLARVFKETEDWAKILDVADVGALNDAVKSEDINELILVAEGLHEKKIANIADKIYENKEKIKIVLIAGPSSSGKTTFSKRLAVQLRVLGLKPKAISLDDYFVDREFTPLDEKGNYDFERLESLDIDLFNKHLTALLAGREVELPVFNFITGKRESLGIKYKMDNRSILVIEGIHGLNETLTSSISKENKYKIYVSALTQLNIDDHNRISTTDVRLLRRIVRDNRYRGKNAEATLLSWESVRNGEEKNIFPYQEEADIMFNSTLVYEMCILKKFAQPLLKEIPADSPAYLEANRLLSFLNYFIDVKDDVVNNVIPNNSILKEFIGGSCFR